MIWFACKQCGKTHGRPEASAGTMIFCDCGQGNLVPWESTAAEPDKSEATAVPAEAAPAPLPLATPAAPRLEPVTFEKSSPPAIPVARPRPRGGRTRPDPNFCFHHPTVPAKSPCADCREGFCADCLVTLQGESLCGPCKNFRVRLVDMPPRVSTMAVVSLILALVTGPLALCVLPLGRSTATFYLSLATLLPQVAALVLGILGLREAEMSPKIGGWSLALTGVLTASTACILTVLVTVYAPRLGI
jgi:hypothetical protein